MKTIEAHQFEAEIADCEIVVLDHYAGGSVTWAERQNVCWVVEVEPEDVDALKLSLSRHRHTFRQDSVCVLTGIAEFV